MRESERLKRVRRVEGVVGERKVILINRSNWPRVVCDRIVMGDVMRIVRINLVGLLDLW